MGEAKVKDSTFDGVSRSLRGTSLLLWILRALVPLKGYREFLKNSHFHDDKLAYALGFGEWADDGFNPDQNKTILAWLKKMHLEAERGQARDNPVIAKNIESLSKVISLTREETLLLQFVVLAAVDTHLRAALESLGDMNTGAAISALSVVVGLTEKDIRSAFSKDATLIKSGLVELRRGGRLWDLADKFELIDDNFADTFLLPNVTPQEMLQTKLKVAPSTSLSFDDFSHIRKHLDILVPFLQQAVVNRRAGVNVLMVGSPGTGKTHLCRLLARELGFQLYEVPSEHRDGELISANGRLKVLAAGQYLLSNSRSLLLLDEAEDVFNDGGFFSRSTAQVHKAWVNALLENNKIPTLWLTNDPNIDPAFIRRFDINIPLRTPPKHKRAKFIESMCGELEGPAAISYLAESEGLTPAIVERAVSVVDSIEEVEGVTKIEQVETLIRTTLEAQGVQVPARPIPAAEAWAYDPGLANTNMQLDHIREGLAHSGSGRLCLYGPPGTGKTAFGQWLADHLDKELYVKRCSDLMSKWLGSTERNIARAFDEAKEQNAVLMLDEVDSFLQDRRIASHSWEVTSVNEFLSQLESYHGIFIATTNRMDNLDQAALRRFDLKLEFSYLQGDALCQLFEQLCDRVRVDRPDETVLSRLQQIRNLAPGDFTVVARQAMFRSFNGPEDLAQAILLESLHKQDKNRSTIGFL